MNIHLEMPSGSQSRGYDREAKDAPQVFAQVVAQLRTWVKFTADVVLSDDLGHEIQREHIANA